MGPGRVSQDCQVHVPPKDWNSKQCGGTMLAKQNESAGWNRSRTGSLHIPKRGRGSQLEAGREAGRRRQLQPRGKLSHVNNWSLRWWCASSWCWSPGVTLDSRWCPGCSSPEVWLRDSVCSSRGLVIWPLVVPTKPYGAEIPVFFIPSNSFP